MESWKLGSAGEVSWTWCPIPRCYHPKDRCVVKRKLLDASEKAYAGVVSTDTEGHHHVTLVVAKTKVAPTRRILLPRLELCGAVILTRLVDKRSPWHTPGGCPPVDRQHNRTRLVVVQPTKAQDLCGQQSHRNYRCHTPKQMEACQV